MHEITKQIRKSGLTKSEWCKRHRVTIVTLNKVIAGERNTDIGEGKRIKELLEQQGIDLC